LKGFPSPRTEAIIVLAEELALQEIPEEPKLYTAHWTNHGRCRRRRVALEIELNADQLDGAGGLNATPRR
jgi:hypothetical protein